MRNEETRNRYYIDGNTVRRAEAAPDYRREQRERIDRQREEELRKKKRIARKNQEKALRMGRSYVIFLTMAVMVFCAFAGVYIMLQSDVTARMSAISSLDSQINDLKADNDEAFKRLGTSIDLDSIKNKAMSELGMSYAKKSQIIYYSVVDDDYMNQYGEIPEN